MKIERLVLGVLDISDALDDQIVAAKFRDFTISWSRYDYRREIIEAPTVDEILHVATERGYEWSLILPYGHVLAERWAPEHWRTQGFFSVLARLVEEDDFLVAGTIVAEPGSWYGFKNQCLLVNLDMYLKLSAPSFDVACEQPIQLPGVAPLIEQGRIAALLPSGQTEMHRPTLDGWQFVAASLQNGLRVVGFDKHLHEGILKLAPECPTQTRAFAKYLNHGIRDFHPENTQGELGQDQTSFLKVIQAQTANARRGVFLWNIESYADIEVPKEDFPRPISSLYSVAAGFKPNRILHTHGWDDATRVVFFDYSPVALTIREYMIDEWDGQDFPDFVAQLFRTYPPPETFYQLWGDLTPDQVAASDIERMWRRELQRWNGAQIFQDHWQAYRQLDHAFVCCDLLTDPTPLCSQIDERSGSVIWWSNAFFTMYGNWFYSLLERQQAYDNWIEQIVTRNPDLYLFGSDYNNISVNSIRAAEYWDQYRRSAGSCLIPCRLSETEIRT